MTLRFRPSHRRLSLSLLAIFGLLLAGGGYAAIDWYAAAPPDALAKATYVGRQSCAECHAAEVEAFTGSHHDRAMELATPDSVRGNFNDATFERMGVTTRFFRKGDKYFVNTEGPDGKLADFEVKYTFGYEPLQQYMVAFPDGRVQVLRESWDTVKNEWFYVPRPTRSMCGSPPAIQPTGVGSGRTGIRPAPNAIRPTSKRTTILRRIPTTPRSPKST
jgi:hypothetical protein